MRKNFNKAKKKYFKDTTTKTLTTSQLPFLLEKSFSFLFNLALRKQATQL